MKIRRIIKSLVDDIIVYLATLAGVLTNQFYPLLTKGKIDFSIFQMARLGASAIVALVITIRFELQGDQDAKKIKIKKRIFEGYSHGVFADMGVGALGGVAISLIHKE